MLRRWGRRAISGFEYLLGVYFVLNGAMTMFYPTDTTVSHYVNFLYGTRTGLVIAGILISFSGAALLYGKIKKHKKWHGRGLFYIYLATAFATMLQIIAYGGDPSYWVGNAIAAVIIGLLFLRWRHLTAYIDPEYIYKKTLPLREDLR